MYDNVEATPSSSSAPQTAASVYPSSRGKTDWNKLEQEITAEEEEEKKNLQGEESLNNLLKVSSP